MPVSDIHKFERDNNISINLYGYDKGGGHLIQKCDVEREKHIDLLLYKEHYCWIKNFSRFCGKSKTDGKCRTHYCS
eukprot:COSAG02_NODE_49579_length_326_cov_0.599119_1_plen_75_part_10